MGSTLSLYQVISEILEDLSISHRYPPEPYRIAHLVVASSRSQAKWLAWKTDGKTFCGDIREMPRFGVVKVADVDGLPVGVLPHDSPYWEFCDGIEKGVPA